jgi:hypothetical protein
MSITPLTSVSLSVNPQRWRYESDNRMRIEKYWHKIQAENSALHNGGIYMLTDWTLGDGMLKGSVQPASYASFLYWREQGYPEIGTRNCFGSSVLQSQEGHILFGRMAAHTLTSGLVYPVGGSFGDEDVSMGALHVETNIARELVEETGLTPQAGRRQDGYICVEEGPRMALAATFVFDCASGELRNRIIAHLEMCDDPELDEVVIFRRKSFGRHHRMPGYARMLLDYLLPQ